MSTVTATASDAVLISPTQLLALQAAEPVVLIDTRDADTYALGHIPGAVNLRETFTYLATSTPQGLQELKDTFAAHLGAIGLSGAETAVFYEDALNSGYGQSCRGYYLLTWLGYPKVKVLNGGYSAWKAAELPVSTEAVVPTPAIFPTQLATTDVMLTKEDVSRPWAPTPCCWTCAMWTSGLATAPALMARTLRRAKAACRAPSGWSGTAS